MLLTLVNTSEIPQSPRVRNLCVFCSLLRIISVVLSSFHHCVISDAAGVPQLVRLHLKTFPKPNITSGPAGNEVDGHSNARADAHSLNIHFFMSVRTTGAASLAAGLKQHTVFPLEISIIRHYTRLTSSCIQSPTADSQHPL